MTHHDCALIASSAEFGGSGWSGSATWRGRSHASRRSAALPSPAKGREPQPGLVRLVLRRDGEAGLQVYKADRPASAARVRAGWERAAAEPGHAAARDAVLLDAVELLLQARKEQVSAGRKSEATFGFYREKTGHWLRVLGEDFPLAQLSATDVDRYITHRRSEWSVPPRDPVLDEEGKFSSRRERAGM